jgi:hypothetical protein
VGYFFPFWGVPPNQLGYLLPALHKETSPLAMPIRTML